ncbi:ureidoglycolate hydrolase [Planoprotostelium fungivorum]|nr:ureidoglycolate hydrolase [Planoprotostelium fungivorum]
MNDILIAEPLTKEAYAPYGNVLEASTPQHSLIANQGSAQRYNWLSELINKRSHAKANLCVFRCKPRELPFNVKILEKHPNSTQMFVPMNAKSRYLVVVSLGGDTPDLSTLRVFVASSTQSITYHPNIWHHPMIALDTETDFVCLVYEDGSAGDTVVVNVKDSLCTVPARAKI